jgi:hypothetical protein
LESLSDEPIIFPGILKLVTRSFFEKPQAAELRFFSGNDHGGTPLFADKGGWGDRF